MAALTEEQGRLFKGRNFAVVGTVGRDGSPQLTPNWIDWDGEHVLLNTAEGRVKPRNIRRNPIVSVCVVNYDHPYQYVSIVGRADISEEGAVEHINELSRRYRGREFRLGDGEKRLLVRIKPERVVARGF
jgi:PPOX class probable F420-dependent enzyme